MASAARTKLTIAACGLVTFTEVIATLCCRILLAGDREQPSETGLSRRPGR